MSKYITSKGTTFKVDFPCIIEREHASKNGVGKTWVEITSPASMGYAWVEHFLQVYYRPERTWDDHMGNTPCGCYVNVPLPTGETRRVYMHR